MSVALQVEACDMGGSSSSATRLQFVIKPPQAPCRSVLLEDDESDIDERGGPLVHGTSLLHGSFAAGLQTVWRKVEQPESGLPPYYYSEVAGISKWERPAATPIEGRLVTPVALERLSQRWESQNYLLVPTTPRRSPPATAPGRTRVPAVPPLAVPRRTMRRDAPSGVLQYCAVFTSCVSSPQLVTWPTVLWLVQNPVS